MKKRIFFRIALILLTIGWMVLIFSLSEKGGEDSAEASGSFTKAVQRIFFREWESLTTAEFEEHMSALHFLVRKAAHFTEFFVLGILLASVFYSFGLKMSVICVAAVLTGVLYAVSDELHQLFVSGRTMALFDILVDTAGIIFGVSGSFSVFLLWFEHRINKDQGGGLPLQSIFK